jgi:hypothetical protein
MACFNIRRSACFYVDTFINVIHRTTRMRPALVFPRSSRRDILGKGGGESKRSDFNQFVYYSQ